MVYNLGCVSGTPFNENHERNFCNTLPMAYNCGGFALRLYNWYSPILPDTNRSEIFDLIESTYTPEQRLHVCIKAILQEVIGSRLIKSLNELQDGEEAVAFRLQEIEGCEASEDPDDLWQDFHFMRRRKDGVWLDKCGGGTVIRAHAEEEVLSQPWTSPDNTLVYAGEIALFACRNWEEA